MIVHSHSMIQQAILPLLARARHPGAMVKVLGALLFAFLLPPPAHAATFNVNSTADAVDMTIGDGICASDAKGTCTLRAAIQEANAKPDQDTINLPPGTYNLTLTGAGEDLAATGDLDILNNLVLMGTGTGEVIISGSGDRVFDILAPATVTISGVIIENGNAQADVGGGIRNAGMLTLTSVAIAHNMASEGGGIANVGSGSAQLTNVTISGNSASGNGGGIANTDKDTSLSLLNVTVSANSAGQGNGIANFGTANPNNTIKNTIVANGTVGNCSGEGLTSLGHNIDTSPSSICLASLATGDLSTDPMLGPLKDNGGFTLTQALLSGSPAIDAGDNMGCPPTDQRGQPRPADGNNDGIPVCDIGAYEAPGPAPPTPTPTGTGGSTSTPTPTATPLTPTATPGGPSIDLSTAMGNPGDQVTFAATLTTGGAAVAGTQNYITFDPVNAPIPALSNSPDCTGNQALNKATNFFFQPMGCATTVCSKALALIFPLPSLDPIPDGSTLYTCKVNISPNAAAGEYPLMITGVVLSNSAGTPVPDPIGRDGKIVVVARPTPTATPAATNTSTATGTSTPTSTSTPKHVPCVGDCNGNHVVTIDEVVTMVDIALDPAGARPCPGADANGDGKITVDETLTAAGNLLNGCRP